jgi:DNA helicase-2/ATP-dependent DNA helicase PcrA
MKPVTRTPEQEAIVEATRGGASLSIRAYAGTGKSTTLQMLATEIRTPALALAFNASAAAGLRPRLPGNFKTQTLNALGFGALTRGHPHVNRFEIDDKKLGKLITQQAKEGEHPLTGETWEDVRGLVREGMAQGIVPGDSGMNPLLADSLDEWGRLASNLLIEPQNREQAIELARGVLSASNELVKKGTISFDDQVYYSTCVRGVWPKYPTILVDEAQDLSSLNHQMLKLALRPGGRLIAVGDPRQAIYAFRGSDIHSMDNLEALLGGNWLRLPLSVTFRCPKVVVARQQAHAPGYTADEGNPQGEVIRLLPGWGLGQLPEAVLCRNNAPLMALAFRLLRGGQGVNMLGKDLGKGLIGLTKKLAPGDGTPIGRFLDKLGDWEARQESEGAKDRAEALRATASTTGCGTTGELRRLLTRLFSENEGVVLSSIHKAKGLEWDSVMVLDGWRLGLWGEASQEANLRYVAETRTKRTLVLGNLRDNQEVGPDD